ncbi:MAG: glycoside-pentoside-hexuronide (GPH):cation symporter [Treponema sp.]|jgi:melibiose permease/lactose/raffinose/galactose permease|nr:glycoside-pentoside-hexuronide (GPH):cation symporter [Treponema sp.]
MQNKQNRFTFGLGTIGRDMIYALVSMFLMFYLTDVLELSTAVLWWIAGIIVFARVFDALNDPFMGFIIDNTNTRWGKFKPWIATGALLTAVFTVLLFTNFRLQGTGFIIMFAVFYVMWGISFTINDISYWSMLPTLSVDQKERERIGSLARICANIGLFFVVAGIEPITRMLGETFGSSQKAFFVFAICITLFMLAGQCITLFGVKETKLVKSKTQATPLRELFGIIVKNDQLLFTTISTALFMIGYTTTTTFGIYFFKYAYGNEGMYGIFAGILGISQLTALSVFPLFSKHFDRKTLFSGAIVLVAIGYILFFFAPVTTMLFIGIAGVLIFLGQSFVQLLMLMFLADSVDYGHWKLGKRNDSITFSLQPFIYKVGGAVSSGVVMAVIIISGINEAETAAEVTPAGLLMMKSAMLLFPLICIVFSYFIYRAKYKIDAKFYAQILSDLEARGEIKCKLDP